MEFSIILQMKIKLKRISGKRSSDRSADPMIPFMVSGHILQQMTDRSIWIREITWESELWNLIMKMKEYYGEDCSVYLLYIQVEDGERLERALKREREQTEPQICGNVQTFSGRSGRIFRKIIFRDAGIEQAISRMIDLDNCVREYYKLY